MAQDIKMRHIWGTTYRAAAANTGLPSSYSRNLGHSSCFIGFCVIRMKNRQEAI